MTKEQIIEAIRQTTEENKGEPLGMVKFFEYTGIKRDDWHGKFWTKWSDAIKEAGFTPNEFSIPAYDINFLFQKVAEYIQELESFPTKGEFKIKKHNDNSFPSLTTLNKRLGYKIEMAEKLIEFCEQNEGFNDVQRICSKVIENSPSVDREIKIADSPEEELGTVYLMKSGKFYKIGKTKHAGGRNYQLGIQLPEKISIIHEIQTDDPSGIEKYWHNRFDNKRKNGEWFDLDKTDVKAFKRRKFM